VLFTIALTGSGNCPFGNGNGLRRLAFPIQPFDVGE
jgi:hypothetical protein